MSQSKRLAAHRATASVDPESSTTEPTPVVTEPDNNSTSKETDMTDQTSAEAVAEAEKKGTDAGFKAANDRMNKVFASEHYAGREALAAKMLGKPSMSAEDIIDLLADTPKAATATGLTEEQQREAAEAAGRETMKIAIDETANSSVDASGGDKNADAKAKATNHGWDKIHAEVDARRAASA